MQWATDLGPKNFSHIKLASFLSLGANGERYRHNCLDVSTILVFDKISYSFL